MKLYFALVVGVPGVLLALSRLMILGNTSTALSFELVPPFMGRALGNSMVFTQS